MTTVSNWDATTFFERLTDTNILARNKKFRFCKVSGLQGFEDALASMQTTTAFVCVSDTAEGYTELNNSPRTRRVKTVFFAMRHQLGNMAARLDCFDTMRELFRQYMSVCRCLSWSRPSFRNAPCILIRASASPRYPNTSLRAAPALRSKSLSISIPIFDLISPNGCRKQHSRSFLPAKRRKHRRIPFNLKPKQYLA